MGRSGKFKAALGRIVVETLRAPKLDRRKLMMFMIHTARVGQESPDIPRERALHP